MSRYCPMCNRRTDTHEETIGPCGVPIELRRVVDEETIAFRVLTCAACGHVHAIRELAATP